MNHIVPGMVGISYPNKSYGYDFHREPSTICPRAAVVVDRMANGGGGDWSSTGRVWAMRLYKLTSVNGQTLGRTQWGESVSHTATGSAAQKLCTDGWIHAYESPEIAVLLNPVHSSFDNPRLWEAEGEIGLRDGQRKCGCRTLTTIREIPLPLFTKEQMVRFAIYCSAQIYGNEVWRVWAARWLDGTDRSKRAAMKIPFHGRYYDASVVVYYLAEKAYELFSIAIASIACDPRINLLTAIDFAKGNSNELPEVLSEV